MSFDSQFHLAINFTVDTWIRLDSSGGDRVIFNKDDDITLQDFFVFGLQNDDLIQVTLTDPTVSDTVAKYNSDTKVIIQTW